MTKSEPYVLHVRDLIRSPGEVRDRTVEMLTPEHLGEGLVAVPEGEPLEISVRLESLHEGILASGTVKTRAAGECARCLAPLVQPVRVEFAELFAYPQEEPYDYELHDDTLDLEQVVRDAVVLSLPFQPECAGGCDDIELSDGITLVPADAEQAPVTDARWAALQQFQQRSSEDRSSEDRSSEERSTD